jgi:3',5'-cyclic AMP phosphodiesterase CpdA
MTHSRRTAAGLAAVATLSVAAVAFAQNPPADRPSLEARTHQPTPVPDRIILTWMSDPTTTQAVTWRTDTTVTRAVAQIALADHGPGIEPGWYGYDPKKVTTGPARTELLKTAINEAHYHSVNFEGLQPKTRYVYRVGDGTVWSEWFQFETASTEPEPFGFVYFGDAQNGIKTLWSRVARGAYSDMPRARFIIHAGDLIDGRNNDAQWGEWHTAAGWINGMVPSVPTPGNHEYGNGRDLDPHWRAQFTLPENGPPGLEETCYYLDFQGVRVISLNTEEKLAEQATWLEGVLAGRPPGIRWTVVTFHRPIYSTMPGRDNKDVHDAWLPVLDRHAVDLVLQGHDHSYGRSGLMRGDNALGGTQVHTGRGTVYVVSVSGAKMYSIGGRTWMANANKGEGVQLYQLIRIDGDVLRYESRTARGDLFDAFRLRKRPDGGNDLIEGEAPPLPEQPADGTSPRLYWYAAGGMLGLAVLGLGAAWLRARNGHATA